MNKILTMETKKYEIKINNFAGPLDLLCHLIDKNKLNINEIKISDIADQYIEYINKMEELNLDVTSEFVLMASTLLYLKSKSLLPKQVEDEGELTEEQLIERILEYKRYKEIAKKFKEDFAIFSKRFYKLPDKIELPNRKLEDKYSFELIETAYKKLIEKNKAKINEKSSDIEKIAISETVTVASKVKDIFRELLRNSKFIFNKLCLTHKYSKLETITAFTGLLELTRRNKIKTEQETLFGDILVQKNK